MKTHYNPTFPGTVLTRVRFPRPDYWGTEYHVTVRMARNIPEYKQAEILTRVYMWQESMPTGERDEGRTIYDYPMGIFGNIGYRCFNVNFLD